MLTGKKNVYKWKMSKALQSKSFNSAMPKF